MRYVSARMLLIHVSAVALIGICIFLSIWQWDRAHLPSQASSTDERVSLNELSPVRDYLPVTSVGRKVYARGHFVEGSTYFYGQRPTDGTHMLGEQSFSQNQGWVVLIFQLMDSTYIAVVAGASEKENVPTISPSVRTISGYLQPSEDSPNLGIKGHFDVARPAITLENLRTLNNAAGTLHDGYLVLTRAPKGLVTVKPIFTESLRAPLHWRNVVYTFNWLFFALVIVAMWWRIVRDEMEDVDSAQNRANLSHE